MDKLQFGLEVKINHLEKDYYGDNMQLIGTTAFLHWVTDDTVRYNLEIVVMEIMNGTKYSKKLVHF